MANTPPAPTFRRGTDSAGTYHQFSQEKVACSLPLSDLIIADCDANGAVRCIEFVGKQTGSLEKFLELARKAGTRPMRKTRGPIPGLAKSA